MKDILEVRIVYHDQWFSEWYYYEAYFKSLHASTKALAVRLSHSHKFTVKVLCLTHRSPTGWSQSTYLVSSSVPLLLVSSSVLLILGILFGTAATWCYHRCCCCRRWIIVGVTRVVRPITTHRINGSFVLVLPCYWRCRWCLLEILIGAAAVVSRILFVVWVSHHELLRIVLVWQQCWTLMLLELLLMKITEAIMFAFYVLTW